MRKTALVVLLLVATGAFAQVPPPDDPELLAKLVEASEGNYTKIGEQAYSVNYTGKNLKTMTVRIFAAASGIFFFVDLVDRDKLALSKNLLLKVAELNSDYDYSKIALSERTLHVRVDVRAANLSAEEFAALEGQAANTADEVYAQIKDFLP
jgi:hypothetical protein